MHAGIPRRATTDGHSGKQDVRRTIDLAGKSAPGPDGIPFEAYKKLGVLATGVLFATLTRLTEEGAKEELTAFFPLEDGSCGFNHSLMVFLPKKKPRAQLMGLITSALVIPDLCPLLTPIIAC